MSQFYSAIKWVLGSTQVAPICRRNFKGDDRIEFFAIRRRSGVEPPINDTVLQPLL